IAQRLARARRRPFRMLLQLTRATTIPSIAPGPKDSRPADATSRRCRKASRSDRWSHFLDPPQRTVGAELGDFAGGSFAGVNGDSDDTDKRAGKDQRHEPGRNVSNTQSMIKRDEIVNRSAGA